MKQQPFTFSIHQGEQWKFETFQGEQTINALIHVIDLQVEGNANYVEPTSKVNTKDEDFIEMQDFMQDFINDDNETPK